MQSLFENGSVIDLIVVFIWLEGMALFAYHRATGRGLAPSRVIANLAAGMFLLLAVRAALTHAGYEWVAASLFAALLGHAADLWSRLRR